METTSAAATAAALPDDAIEEILVRVDDVAALFRCATTCKPWGALVARPSFLRRRWPEDSPESWSLFGFFAQQQQQQQAHGGEQIFFVPAPLSPLGRCTLGSFFPNGADWLQGAEPITSRRGLLLVLLHDRDPAAAGGIRLAVCNPLAGTCDVLPPLDCIDTYFDKEGCGILTSADLPLELEGQHQKPLPLPGYSTFFKVLVCVHQDEWGDDSNCISCGYDLHVFSSDESSWTEPQACFDQLPDEDLETMGCAVVCRGKAHWLFKSSTSDYYALQVEVGTAGHVVSFTKLLIRLDESASAWFHVGTDGALTLLVLRLSWLGSKVEVWTRRPDGGGGDSTAEWLHTGMINLQRPKQKLTLLFTKMKLLQKPKQKKKVGTLYGTLLFTNSAVLVADLRTGAMEDVTAQFRGLDSRDSVPFEVDWTGFFSSRLGMVGGTTCLEQLHCRD